MTQCAIPMIHVPNVAATVHWYVAIGFELVGSHEENGEMLWAKLSFGESALMLNAGGTRSDAERRDVDLYIYVDDLAETFARVTPSAELVESIHDTEYGMREFIVRDPNRFWLTFGQPLPSPASAA